MTLFAETFWKDPNVFDVAGVLGLIIGVISVWLSWWLAKRDIERRITESAERASKAARDEVRRVAQTLLQSGLANTIRFLELSREAANGRQWRRAADLCVLAREQLARVLAQPIAEGALLAEIRDVSAALIGYLTALAAQTRANAGELTQDVQRSLEEAILTLHRADAHLTGIRTE